MGATIIAHMTRARHLLAIALCIAALAACTDRQPPPASGEPLPPAPAGLAEKVAAYLDAARPHAQHAWRDMAPLNADGTVNGYVEISRGESTKWEFRIPLNRREVDRMIPEALGGYPINYGFLPQTVSYDGDPADVLFAGPPIEGGQIVRGRIIGFMRMMDTGDLDSKVIITPLDDRGQPLYTLDAADRERIAGFFDTYKNHDGKSTKVTGWGDEAEARAFLKTTAGFFSAR
jgi:inorganic pyrophosphatase